MNNLVIKYDDNSTGPGQYTVKDLVSAFLSR